MKLKLLSLGLAIGIFVFGVAVKAQESQVPTRSEMPLSTPVMLEEDKDLVKQQAQPSDALCIALIGTGYCSACDPTNINTCFREVAQNYKNKEGFRQNICVQGCTREVCKTPAYQAACMEFCCLEYPHSIEYCLKQNGGKSCP